MNIFRVLNNYNVQKLQGSRYFFDKNKKNILSLSSLATKRLNGHNFKKNK